MAAAASQSVRSRARPQRRARKPAGSQRAGIRWDRLGRVSLLVILVLVIVSYVGPANRYLKAWSLAGETRTEVRDLRQDNQRLRVQAERLRDPETVELEARKRGMARPGERVYVIRGLAGESR